ncbi:MAG: hypothetical protein NZ741_12110, partial [Armatimonadetes bacterium]|nr:hypothetical protein [Armatimonadota bacterium]
MCAVALISFLLAWKYPLFWLVFLWSLWVMSKQTRATYYYQTTYQPTPPRNAPPPPRHTLYDL